MTPDPQDPLSPLYDFIDTQPASPYPNQPDSSLSHFSVRQFTPEAITATWPVVVTKTGHGMLPGQSIRTTQFTILTGMQQLNNKQFYIQQVTIDTFQLYDTFGLPVDGRNYNAYILGGQMTKSGPEILCVNPSHFPPAGVPDPFAEFP